MESKPDLMVFKNVKQTPNEHNPWQFIERSI
jgi:hypothetical protein